MHAENSAAKVDRYSNRTALAAAGGHTNIQIIMHTDRIKDYHADTQVEEGRQKGGLNTLKCHPW